MRGRVFDRSGSGTTPKDAETTSRDHLSLVSAGDQLLNWSAEGAEKETKIGSSLCSLA